MVYDYFLKTLVNATLDLENPGNCAISASNDSGEFFYLVIRTYLGTTRIFEYGPIVPESSILPKAVSVSFKRIEYSESKIGNIIKSFLNSPYSYITQAQEVTFEEALENCINIADYMNKEEAF